MIYVVPVAHTQLLYGTRHARGRVCGCVSDDRKLVFASSSSSLFPLIMPTVGASHENDVIQHGRRINPEAIKTLSELPTTGRRYNDYTTIPRQTRHRARDRQRDESTLKRRDHVTVTSAEDDPHPGCKDTCPDDVYEQRKEKSFTISRIKNIFRNLKSDRNNSKHVTPSPETAASKTGTEPVSGSLDESRAAPPNDDGSVVTSSSDDSYADIESLRDLSHCVTCQSRSGSMALTLESGGHVRESSQRGGVLKTLASLSARNVNTTRRRNPKKNKYENGQSKYRGSFKENTMTSVTGRRLASNIECKRCSSFTISTSGRCTDGVASSGVAEGDVSGGSVTYSLAKAEDVPPPLPERTYLRLRRQPSKENPKPADVINKEVTGSDGDVITGSFRFSRRETNNNNNYKPASYPNTIPDHVHLRALPATCRREGELEGDYYKKLKPFHVPPTGAPSSGDYSTRAPPTSSGVAVVDRAPIPPPVATLPTRTGCTSSRLVGATSGLYEKRKHVAEHEPASSGSVVLRQTDADRPETPHRLRPSVIHNLPLPPGPGGAQLIRTLHLDNILKNRWISGIAVTRKNEYIVVDQREAYLLDDEGNLKKAIGAKGSSRLIEPFDVAVSPSNGNLVICDHAEQDVKIYTWKGQFVKRVNDPTLTNIAGVSVTEARDVVIAGTDKQRVSVISEDGKLLYTIPNCGADSARTKNRPPFEHPYSVAVNPLTFDIIIGDDYKQIVTAVSSGKDGQDIRVLWRYCPGPGDRHFFPSAICADNKGYIFIADLYNEKVYMLDSSGKYVKTLLSRGDGLKGGPGAIATDNRGHLLVADEEKSIKVFKYRDENGFAVTKRYSYCP